MKNAFFDSTAQDPTPDEAKSINQIKRRREESNTYFGCIFFFFFLFLLHLEFLLALVNKLVVENALTESRLLGIPIDGASKLHRAQLTLGQILQVIELLLIYLFAIVNSLQLVLVVEVLDLNLEASLDVAVLQSVPLNLLSLIRQFL